MKGAALITALAATLVIGACTGGAPRDGASSTGTSGALPLDACGLLPRSVVDATLPGNVTLVRKLTADDFMVAPPPDSRSCAYETDGGYGELIVTTQPINARQYELRFAEGDPYLARKVPDLGEEARLSGCGGLSIYTNGRLLQLGIQYERSNACPRLISLGRAALQQP
jgi:hypothetical protein